MSIPLLTEGHAALLAYTIWLSDGAKAHTLDAEAIRVFGDNVRRDLKTLRDEAVANRVAQTELVSNVAAGVDRLDGLELRLQSLEKLELLLDFLVKSKPEVLVDFQNYQQVKAKVAEAAAGVDPAANTGSAF